MKPAAEVAIAEDLLNLITAGLLRKTGECKNGIEFLQFLG